MSKGGARRFSVPPVDMDALQGIIDRAVESKGAAAFLLGEYDTKKVTTAVSAAGLHQNAAWVKDFFNISKGEILAGQLKQCIQKYGHSHNTSDWKDDLWAGKIASQMVCILSHVRRLGREPDKLRQCLQGQSGTLFGKKGEAKGPERLAEERAAFLELQQKLKFHEETQKAIQGLKEGQLSEDEFWNKLCKNEKTALWKKFECERNKSPEARKAWLEMEGKGVMEKKKQLLLHFIETGQKSAGGLKQSQEASQSKQENELFEWVPWKQVQDWYGKDEALARVEQGPLPVRKVGRKFFEFLLVKQQTTLSLEQKKRLAAEQEMALKGPELLACKKALAAGRTEKEWEALWSERRPEKSFQLEDALSESSSDTSPGEEVATDEEADAALTFLRGLRKGQSEAETNKDKKKTKEEKKAEQESKKQQLKAAKEEKQKKLEAEKLAKQKAAAEKWSKKLEEATQVGEDEKETKVKKMLSIVSKEVADLKKACKKASSSDWGKHELANLSKCRDELEDLQMDCLESVKEKLLQSAAALKASQKLIEK
ncbi:unnamed protein product [Durusdinium trenchii]|uniref:Uncharacterized protein n=1 Tax=Durusdinium trenchii TaxID=1381693 RepID=A0ABP0P361_9DINO